MKKIRMSKKLKQVCLFIHYNPINRIDGYVLDYLKQFEKIGFQIVLISNSAINSQYKQLLTETVSNCTVYERENKGADFGAWKWAISKNLIPEDTDYLLLANDSVFGPLFPLEPILETMQGVADIDFWGLTDCLQGGWHLQSYFIYLSKKAFTSEAFKHVFQTNFNDLHKRNIIQDGELKLSQALIDAGFKGAAYVPYNTLDTTYNGSNPSNPTHYYWAALIQKFKHPFIKKDLILQNPEHLESVGSIFEILESDTTYSIEHIKETLITHLLSINHANLTHNKISVLCHLYYPESVYYFISKIAVLKSPHTKFIFNLSSALYYSSHFIDVLSTVFPDAIILYTPNQGRDIGGKMAAIDVLLRSGIETDYSIIIHDKVSPHTPTGLEWRNNLLKIIDPEYLPKVYKKLSAADTGIVTSVNFIKNEFDPDKNQFSCTSTDQIFSYIKKFSLTVSNYNFAAGTIFWIKTSILKEFFSTHPVLAERKGLEKGNALDFDKGTFLHAWERLFSFIAHSQGYKTTGI